MTVISLVVRVFGQGARPGSDRWREIHALYEIGYTLVDFSAALLFIVGSIFFFYESLVITGTWLFLIGSICFAAKPTIRLVRDVHHLRRGELDRLAGTAE